MKKIINFRPLFYCFLALFGAILFAKHIFLSNWVVIAVFFLIVFAIVTTCFLRKKLKILVAILAFIFLGLGLYGLEMSFFSQPKIPNGSTLYGRVENVSTYDEMQCISRELMLIKVKYNKTNRKDIMELCDIMKADIVDMSKHFMMIQICDSPERIRLMLEMLKTVSIVEVARTGTLALSKCIENDDK